MMRTLLAAFLTVLLLGAVYAEEPDARDRRQVDPSRLVDLPFAHLRLRDDLRLTEGPRSLRDAFPYLAVAPETFSSTNATALTPKNLGRFLVQAPQKGGTVPAAIRTGDDAVEAVRLFVAGPLVTSIDAGDRVLAAGRALSSRLDVLTVRVTAHRPATWLPHARPLDQDKSQHPIEAWEVSLVALEMDRKLRLVHVKARVSAAGRIEIARHAIVDGPATTWQSEGELTGDARRRDALARAEVGVARTRFAAALRTVDEPDLDTAWAVTRADPRMGSVRLWLGEPDRDVGSGIHIRAYDLSDGGTALFGEVGDPLIYAYWSDPIDRPGGRSEIRRRLYVGPSR